MYLSYVTIVFMQYGGLLAVRNRRVSILQSNPLWGPRQNLMVPVGMVFTMLIAVVNLYGPGLQDVFATTPIPGMFWGLPFTFALGILVMDELRKLIVRTYPKVSNITRYLRRVTDQMHTSPSLRAWRGSDLCFYQIVDYCVIHSSCEHIIQHDFLFRFCRNVE